LKSQGVEGEGEMTFARRSIPRLSEKWHQRAGLVKARMPMTRKLITVEFVVPTVLAVALVILLSIGAVSLADIYLGAIEQAEAHYSAGGR
jgi:hypothetical protein